MAGIRLITISQRGQKVFQIRHKNGEVLMETWRIDGVKAVITFDDNSKMVLDGEKK